MFLDLLVSPLAHPFFLRALTAGLLLAIAASFIGVFVVLRKMSFFGDAVGHFAFTGIALGFLLGFDPILAAVVFSILIAIGVGYLEDRTTLSLDTTIGIFFSGAAALGIFLIGLLRGYRADLFQYLFGDILAITQQDIIVAALLVVVTLTTMALAWRPLLQITFNKDLARVNGVKVDFWEYAFLVLLALVTAASIKTVGILLVTALLIVPAAAAKQAAKNIRQLLVFTIIISLLSVVFGLFGSYYWNTASGPAIILVSLLFFVLSLLW
ncbi:hypothetical protein A3I40_00270 [Candidatus Uhrbacteria bacterium RIFCSPLOWO2_02_FULL_48_12]|uniref:ABC transporter n=1 Tax=Candidatus Uhrbacteria bacterium RIFCSPLOWO2_02_FULL_48_12 TaxID=1802407 RepID=A0A1F7V8T7_9BACT|nr:MAG: hypothetical protein A3I40_00270 [Candidatus Uhrbacteria bacterium RIFCSPLOWO2_02_FULL_48_12]